MKGLCDLFHFILIDTTGKAIGHAKPLGLFLFLVCLLTAMSMGGCGSGGGGGGGGNLEEPSGPLSLEQIEQFWLDAYQEVPLEEGVEPLAASKREFVAKEEPLHILMSQLLAKADPDECFNGIGEPYPDGPPCDEGISKVNQAYVLGLTKSGDDLWFGTAPNVHCLVLGTYLGANIPHETASWVCEFGSSQFSPPLPDFIGDWRPPRIFAYSTENGELVEKTPDHPLIGLTLGIRSAGTLGDVVILGGPTLSPEGGINLFAFNTETGECEGLTTLPDYRNIRKWLVVDDVLYTAVGNTDGTGSVLRWIDDVTDAHYPFAFEEVGELDGAGAELAEHEGRLFVSTWPGGELAGDGGLAGIWMSPPIPVGGFTSKNFDQWTKVWQVDDYEPSWVTAATYGGGALASFDGYLYWGTMHVPLLSALAHFSVYGPPEDLTEALKAVLGTYRAITIFRGRNFGTEDQETDLVYGMTRLPVYRDGKWWIVPNNMGRRPLWGLSGFGNFFNNYTWTMKVYHGQLFVGTMDWSYLFFEILNTFLESEMGYVPERKLRLPTRFFGADLWRFLCADSPAIPESLAGVGNYTSYGIRTMVSEDALYLGMANPMNLLTDPEDDMPEGGWELIRLEPGFRIKIDIKPGSYPNPINLKSRGKVPVAVLTTRCFWAKNVDPETVIFAGAEPVRWTMEDVDYDGDMDLLFHFQTQELDLTKESKKATLTGTTYKGLKIEGTDTVKIVPRGK